jgi:hypothetical protein
VPAPPALGQYNHAIPSANLHAHYAESRCICDDGLLIDPPAPPPRYQGLAASGGDRPLPLLWRVVLPSGVEANADQLTALLLPSVRVFISYCSDSQAALLTACALRQVGFEHTWELRGSKSNERDDLYRIIRAIARCKVVDGGVALPSLDDLGLGSLSLVGP